MPLKKTLKIAGLVLLGLIVALLVWGLIEPYWLDVEQFAVPIPDLPAEWEGETVAVIGDMQIGMWLDNNSTVAEAVEEIIEEEPTVALLMGDFVYQTAEADGQPVQTAADLVAPLADAGIPTVAVLGNHDYSLLEAGGKRDDELAARVEQALEAAGIPVLVNEALPLEHPDAGPPLYIAGVGSHYAGMDHPETALAAVPAGASHIVMMHNPDTFPKVPASSGPLSIAGHTHGGQIRVPNTPDWSPINLVQGGYHADAWAEQDYGAAGNRLYINRGIGFSFVPLRIFCRPELTFFELTRSPGDTLPQPVEQ